jgi:uncharacterized protein YvpB
VTAAAKDVQLASLSVAPKYQPLNVPFKAQAVADKHGNPVWSGTRNCGQTCALMVMAYYNGTGKPTDADIKQVDDWLAKNEGEPIRDYKGSYTNKDEIATVAREYGGFTDSFADNKWDLQKLRSELDKGHPVIAAVWTDMTVGKPHEQHFMVVTGMDDKYVYVNDPGHTKGEQVKYTIEQFKKAWDSQNNAVVVIEPKSNGYQPPPQFSHLA